MTDYDIYEVEEDFRRKNKDLDHEAFATWLQQLSKERFTRLKRASAYCNDLKAVHAWFLELCATAFTNETMTVA